MVQVSHDVRKLFSRCGMSQSYIDKLRPETRLYHDLNIYGDIAEAYIETMRDEFGINIDAFVFNEYFPPEFENKTILGAIIYMIPYIDKLYRRRNIYIPLTVFDIEKAMATKRFAPRI